MDRVQPLAQWFHSLQTLYITILRKTAGKRRRRREKLPGWTVYNLQSSGFVPCKPCTLHYYVRSLGQGGEAGRSRQGERDTTSSPVVSFLANPVHYIILQEVWDKEEEQGEVARVDTGQGTTSSPVVLLLANPIHHIIM